MLDSNRSSSLVKIDSASSGEDPQTDSLLANQMNKMKEKSRLNMNDTFSKEGWQKVQEFKKPKLMFGNTENDYCELSVLNTQTNRSNAIC